MATSTTSVVRAPILFRLRNYQWYWNSATNPRIFEDQRWEKYTDVENEIIEDAYNEKIMEVEINGGYVIDFTQSIQQKRDSNKQRPIKRVQLDKDRSTYLREERFSLPVAILGIRPSSTKGPRKIDELSVIRGLGHLSNSYHQRELVEKKKTFADVVEEAAHGIVKEGTKLGIAPEAEWLAQQLLKVKPFGNDEIAVLYEEASLEIGQTCVYLYTKETFWYKLINYVVREPYTWTIEQLKTFGPFCYLLDRYLKINPTRDILKVYRSLNLTDEQRQNFMKEEITFTSFTSTSSTRHVAEFYDGNTMLIFYIGDGKNNVSCGANISSLSDFPEEEEFLIRPGIYFDFVKYDYENEKKKHIIHLKPLDHQVYNHRR